MTTVPRTDAATAQQVIGELQKRTQTPWLTAAAVELEASSSDEDADDMSPQGGSGAYWDASMPTQCLLQIRAAYPSLFGGSPPAAAAEAVSGADGSSSSRDNCPVEAAMPPPSPPPRSYKDVPTIVLWGLPEEERRVDAVVRRAASSGAGAGGGGGGELRSPLVLQGGLAEKWPLVDSWTPGRFFEAWDRSELPVRYLRYFVPQLWMGILHAFQ